jgi:glycosyltransferase involved in cell wall biosynthesis
MSASVLMIGNFLSESGGTRSVCEDLALQLRGSGWVVWTASSLGPRPARLIDMLSTAWRRRRQYQVAQVDVFSGPAFCWAEAVCWILRKAGKPYVLTLHGGNLPAFAGRWPGRVRRLLGSAAAVTTPSDYLLQRMRSCRADLQLAPNPLDIGTFRFRPRPHPRPRLIWVRAFHQLYNPTLAPRVVALLHRDFPEIRLTMVGPDKGDGSLDRTKELARKLGVGDAIEFPGAAPSSEIPERLDDHDIFLNTTNADNTPVSVMEAMACGLCVVSTNVGGIPDLLDSGHEALLTPADDEQSMAAAIRRLLTEPRLAETLSRNARRKAEQFDWSAILPQWESLLKSAAAAGKTS